MPQLLRLQSIILVLGNTSCTAAHWMWIIFHGVMHYYAGFNYRIIDWSFPQNSDLIYFDSKYLQNWLWHNHEISVLVWRIWPEERLAWLKNFTFSGRILWVNTLLHFFLQTCVCLYTQKMVVTKKIPLAGTIVLSLAYEESCLLSVSC